MKASPELKAAVYRVIGEAGKAGISTEDIYNRCPMAETLVAVSHAIKELREDGSIVHHMSQAGEGKKRHLVKIYTAKGVKCTSASEWNQSASCAADETNSIMHVAVDQVLEQHAAIEDRAQAVGEPLSATAYREQLEDASKFIHQLRAELENAQSRIQDQAELLLRYEERTCEQDVTISQLRQDLQHQVNLVESYQEGSATINDANKRIAQERDEALEKFAERDLTCKMLHNELEGTRNQLEDARTELEIESQARKNADGLATNLQASVDALATELNKALSRPAEMPRIPDPLARHRHLIELTDQANLNYAAGRAIELICDGQVEPAILLLQDLLSKAMLRQAEQPAEETPLP